LIINPKSGKKYFTRYSLKLKTNKYFSYICIVKDFKSLLTIKNFALLFGVTPAYIYKLVKEGKMSLVLIDGVRFVDTTVYKSIPVTNRRK